MEWIMENLGLISAVATPVIALIVRLLVKRIPKNYQKFLLNVIETTREELLKADVNGNTKITKNEDIDKKFDKIKVDLGLGK